MKHDLIPPEGCTCASFWTVRGVHKKDCPLAPTPSAEELEKIEQRLTKELKHALKLVLPSQQKLFVNELAKWYAQKLYESRLAARYSKRRVLQKVREAGPKKRPIFESTQSGTAIPVTSGREWNEAVDAHRAALDKIEKEIV